VKPCLIAGLVVITVALCSCSAVVEQPAAAVLPAAPPPQWQRAIRHREAEFVCLFKPGTTGNNLSEVRQWATRSLELGGRQKRVEDLRAVTQADPALSCADDAALLLARCYFLYELLPPDLRQWMPEDDWVQAKARKQQRAKLPGAIAGACPSRQPSACCSFSTACGVTIAAATHGTSACTMRATSSPRSIPGASKQALRLASSDALNGEFCAKGIS
jgi:hypothetical protein